MIIQHTVKKGKINQIFEKKFIFFVPLHIAYSIKESIKFCEYDLDRGVFIVKQARQSVNINKTRR